MRIRILPLAMGSCALAGLLLAGCGTLSPATSTPPAPAPAASTPAPAPEGIPVKSASHLYATKPIVEGTELMCVTNANYFSTTCNWELWNKTREGTK